MIILDNIDETLIMCSIDEIRERFKQIKGYEIEGWKNICDYYAFDVSFLLKRIDKLSVLLEGYRDKDAIRSNVVNTYIFSERLSANESSYLTWLIMKAEGKLEGKKDLVTENFIKLPCNFGDVLFGVNLDKKNYIEFVVKDITYNGTNWYVTGTNGECGFDIKDCYTDKEEAIKVIKGD